MTSTPSCPPETGRLFGFRRPQAIATQQLLCKAQHSHLLAGRRHQARRPCSTPAQHANEQSPVLSAARQLAHPCHPLRSLGRRMPAIRCARHATTGCAPWHRPQPGRRPLTCMQYIAPLLGGARMPSQAHTPHRAHAGRPRSHRSRLPLITPTTPNWQSGFRLQNAALTRVQHMSGAWCASGPAGLWGTCPPSTPERCGGQRSPAPGRPPMPAGRQHHTGVVQQESWGGKVAP